MTLATPARRPRLRAPRRPPALPTLTAAVLAIGTLAACGGNSGGADSADASADRVALAGDDRTVRVGVLRQPHLSHPLFYDDFVPANVDLEVIPFASSTEIKNAVVSGDLELGVTGITSALQGAAAGEQVVVVASAADGGSAIVAREDSGITEVADLAGKRIGFVPASAQDVLLRLTLRDVGLDPERDVELVNVGFADMAAALDKGDIDAFSGAETGPSDALVRGGTVLVTHPYDTAMGRINIALVTSRSLVEGDRDLVAAMVEVHQRATDLMAGDTAAWADEVVSSYGYQEASLDVALQNIYLRWDIDDEYLSQVEVLGQQQLELDQIQREPDYATFLEPAFVRAISAR